MHESESIVDAPGLSRPRPADELDPTDALPATRNVPPVREGLPPGFRMRADAHYVDQLDARMSSIPVRLIDTESIESGQQKGDSISPAFVESVRRHGVLQPLLVTGRGNRYRVIAGRRRLAAALAAGLRELPCLVQHVDDEEAERMALASNLPATRPRPASAPPAPAGTQAGAATSELARIVSALVAAAARLDDASILTQTVTASLIAAEATRARDLLTAIRVLRDEVPMARGRITAGQVVDLVAHGTRAECELRRLELDVTATAAARDAACTGDAPLVAHAVSGLVDAAMALVESPEAALPGPGDQRRGRASLTLQVTTPSRGALAFVVSQRVVVLPAAWLARPFEIAWPIRGGASSLTRLQAARRIAQVHGGDVDIDRIDGGVAMRLTIGSDS